MILELDNVEFYRNSNSVLSGVYLKAETGKITSIRGVNGSGTSTLLHIIFGDVQPKYKHLRLDNLTVDLPLNTTGQVRMLPQNPFTPKSYSIEKAFKIYGVSWELFAAHFPQFIPQQKSKVKSLSSGELRLVEAFMVILSDTPIILLDQPFKGISPIYIESLVQLIEREKSKKIIILTDHQEEIVARISDDMYGITHRRLELISGYYNNRINEQTL